jgi:hypothetical protein
MAHDSDNNTLFTVKHTKGLETLANNLLDVSSDFISVLGAYLPS